MLPEAVLFGGRYDTVSYRKKCRLTNNNEGVDGENQCEQKKLSRSKIEAPSS